MREDVWHKHCMESRREEYMRKQQSTSQIFEQFYGKPFDEITQADLDTDEEIDWGEDVGGEEY